MSGREGARDERVDTEPGLPCAAEIFSGQERRVLHCGSARRSYRRARSLSSNDAHSNC